MDQEPIGRARVWAIAFIVVILTVLISAWLIENIFAMSFEDSMASSAVLTAVFYWLVFFFTRE